MKTTSKNEDDLEKLRDVQQRAKETSFYKK